MISCLLNIAKESSCTHYAAVTKLFSLYSRLFVKEQAHAVNSCWDAEYWIEKLAAKVLMKQRLIINLSATGIRRAS